MPNTGLVNGELVNGTGETYFSGNIVLFKQVVQSVYKNQLLCNNVYNGAVYNNYAYNVNSINCFCSDYFIIIAQKVGIVFEGKIFDILQDVILHSTGGGINNAIISFEQTIKFIKYAAKIIDIENIVEEP